jgi:hypothetical protein
MKKYNKSEIFKRAWAEYRKGNASFSECLKHSWAIAICDMDDFAMFDAPATKSKPNPEDHKIDLTTKAGITRFRIIEKLKAGYTQAQL